VRRLGAGRSQESHVLVASGPVTRAFHRLESALAQGGRGRTPPETAAELMARVGGRESARGAKALRAFEQERYGSRPPAEEETRAAVEELDRLASDPAAGRT
jgi:hypothetical protein